MRCSKAQSFLSQELDEQLPADVTRDLDEHLDRCAACREYREDLALGQRLLAASEPELPDNFDWKLQLRLNQALREAAGEHIFPWQEETRSVRWDFLRSFTTSAAVGLAAVLALAMFLDPDAARPPSERLDGAAGPALAETRQDDPTRLNLYGGGLRPMGRQVSGENGLAPRRVTSPLLDRSWSRTFLDDSQAVLYLREEVRRLRTENFHQRRQLEALQTRLDTVPAQTLDTRESR